MNGIETESAALCFYEWWNRKQERLELQAKRFDSQSGLTRYYKPFGGEIVRAGEMWLCRVGETVFTRREDVHVVEEVVRVAPFLFLGFKRGQPINLELERVDGQWRSITRNRSRSGSVMIETDFVFDRQSELPPTTGLGRYYVTKLVNCRQGNFGRVSVVVAVDLEPPAVKREKVNPRLAEVA
ncbi:MAG: hypothetical protein HYT46_02580 [Candidatus Vogelbacteria bacterium]|nr:hypothetical protein [Candidatus Vogelbacteria bacterium]